MLFRIKAALCSRYPVRRAAGPLTRAWDTNERIGDRTHLVLLLVLVFACALPARAAIVSGDVFPSLNTAGLNGGDVPAIDGRVVLVDFWASWCAPCKSSFPAFARLAAEYASRGLVIIAVSVDEKPASFAAFVKKQQPPFATLLDREQKLARTVNVPAMPTSYLIGRDGRVRFIHQGFHGTVTENELRKNIESLLAEKT
jgi:thiol-disulfide isomerase/thioredoxin